MMALKAHGNRYDPATYPDMVREWARQGFLDQDIAKKLGVDPSTFCRWAAKHDQLRLALREGKCQADCDVEQALYKSAMGYDYEETKIIVDADGKPRSIEKTTKKQPPHPTSMIFWLKNRKMAEWRDVQKIQHEGIPEGASDPERIAAIAVAMEEAMRLGRERYEREKAGE